MSYQLNGINVHEGMHARATTARRNGKKVFITKFEYIVPPSEKALEAETHCTNCDGAGRLGLEIVVGGPYDDASDKKGLIWYEDKWYSHDLIAFVCPDCNGSGLFRRKAAGVKELQL